MISRLTPTAAATTVQDLSKLLKAGLRGLETMEVPMTTIADIARFIQFFSYICNDFNDLKGELDPPAATSTSTSTSTESKTMATTLL